MQSFLFRFVLFISALGAIIAPAGAFYYKGVNSSELWAVFAASLAVLTSIFSAWSSMGLMEIERDRQRPNPYPFIDFKSRYGLALFSIKNFGASPAYAIKLDWHPKIKDHRSNEVKFDGEGGELAILMPNQSISKILGSTHDVFAKNNEKQIFTGEITFEDVNKKSYKQSFVIDIGSYKGTPLDDNEQAKTGYMLQKIPEELSKIRHELSKINNNLDSE